MATSTISAPAAASTSAARVTAATTSASQPSSRSRDSPTRLPADPIVEVPAVIDGTG